MTALAGETSPATNSVTLAWDPSPDPAVTGYIVYHGVAGTGTALSIDVGTNLVASISNLQAGTTYYFYVTAYNSARVESVPSNVVTYTPRAAVVLPSVGVGMLLDRTNITERDFTGCLVTFTRTGNTSAALTVQFKLGGSAVNGRDYRAIPTSVVIPAGSAYTTLTIVPVDDPQMNPTKTVELSLVPRTDYLIAAGASHATLFIQDTDKDSSHNGMSDRMALLAGLNPALPQSALRILSVRPIRAGLMEVRWSSVAGITYRLLAKSSLTDADWTVASPPVTARGPTASWMLPATNTACFYGITVVHTPRTPKVIAQLTPLGETALSWSSLPGLTYRVEAADSPTATNWTVVSPAITATGMTADWTSPKGAPLDFYQVVPDPESTPKILSVRPSPSGDVLIRWSSLAGVFYQVQTKTSLAAPEWTVASPVIIGGQPITSWFHHAGNQSSGFYRIAVLPALNPRILAITPAGSNQVSVTWSSLRGVAYQLLTKVSLTDPDWFAVSPAVTATNMVTSGLCPMSSPSGFFKVAVITP